MPSRWIFALLLVAANLASNTRAAQAPQATSITPAFVQRGTQVEAIVAGEALDGVTHAEALGGDGVLIYVDPDTTPPEKRDKKTVGKNLKLRIVAAPTASSGDVEIRLFSPGGVSNPIAFHVGLYPIILEKEPNNSTAQAQKITLPAVITGSIDGGGDVDMFQFSAKKNETIVFEVQAARTGSKLDSSLRVFDMTGKVLAHDEDTNDLDSLIAFHPPQDGEFLLQIRDLRYMGGKDYPYRIVAGPTPYIESVFPPGGQNGTTVEVKPRGYNLEGIAKIPVDVKGYRPSLSHSMKIHGESAAGRSNDVLFDVSDFPEINEAEPNDTVAAANAVSISAKARGIVINGQIGKPKDADYFRFAAIKGHKLSFEIAPGRIGSPIDPLLILFNAKGDFLQQDDVNGKFERGFDADGDFIICVRDLHDRGGPEYPYRLVIREPVPIPTFSVTYTPDCPRLYRGGNTKLWCDVVRENGYAEDITINFDNLPKGVTAEKYVSSTKNPNSGLLILHAAEDAEIGPLPVPLSVQGFSEFKDATNQTSRRHILEPQYKKKTVLGTYLSILEAAPFTVAPVKELSKEEREKFAAERAELEKNIDAQTPELDAAQAKWETEIAAKSDWVVLDAIDFKAQSGATLAKLPDGSLLASGKNDPQEVYSFAAHSMLAGITGMRLEALTDPTLGANGPGRAPNGNFVITAIDWRIAAGDDPKAALAAAPVKWAKATSDFAQNGFPPTAVIDGSKTGWAVHPEMGKPHTAVFEPEKSIGDAGAKTFAIALEFKSPHVQHTIGRFRISVTTATKPGLGGPAIPEAAREIVAIEKTKRTPEQAKKLADYFRSISPELAAKRERLAQLSNLDAQIYPPVLVRNIAGNLSFDVKRAPGFKGEIKLTIAGFTTGSNTGDEPPPATNLDITPATLKDDQTHGVIGIKPKGDCPVGTRDIVIIAECKVGDETITQFSERIPLTVNEKKAPEKEKK